MMKKGTHLWILLVFCISACQQQPTPVQPTTAAESHGMALSSPAFQSGQKIPDIYTCANSQIGKSPELLWTNVPAGAQSLALIAEDPDAPMGIFYHWVVYNIPPALTELPEGMPAISHVVGIGTQGINGFSTLGYGGPCPPFGQTHRYYFHLYALDLGLSLPEGLDSLQLKTKMMGHVLAQADWMGMYK
jgi:Raf kinase inhibitor-like YbhB/YbcL family protein